MFRLEEILCSNLFVRRFQTITKNLNDNPGALLITRRVGDHFVFLNAKLYQELLDSKLLTPDQKAMMEYYHEKDSQN